MAQRSSDPPGEYRFGACRIDLPSRQIFRGGKSVAIEPKAFDLLVYLIENRDRAISKDELQDTIWPRVIVTEAALTRCVMKARRAIGIDEAIVTVRGHGYRFAAPIEDPAQDEQSPLPQHTGQRPSVVVLPFASIGPDGGDDYFADGITDDIITELSRFRSLFVIARPSAFSYKGRSVRARQVASELGVAYVIDGTVQRSGHRLRLNVRLVDATDEAQMWSERYDRDLEDVLLVQEELAATVAATIGGRVEVARGRRRLDRSEIESYDCLLRAQLLYYEFRKDANAEARLLLERSLELDPENARALAILAAVHSMDSWTYWSEDPAKSQRLSLEYGRRSIELDDTDSLSLALFAEILHDCGDQRQADYQFRRAIALNPNDIAARALYASKLAAADNVDAALQQLAVAERLDPFSLGWIPVIKVSVLFVAGRYEEVLDVFDTIASPPVETMLVAVAALGRLGHQDRARATLERLLRAAESQMPGFPGARLEDWLPMIRRMRCDPPDDRFEEFVTALRMAGWE